MLLVQDTRLRCGFNINRGSNVFLNLCRSTSKNKKFNINGKSHDTKGWNYYKRFYSRK